MYGHKIRELLLLACMEVESSWTAVLKINEYGKGRLTTQDYVKLLSPMYLDRYWVNLPSYKYPSIKPFEGWDAEDPKPSPCHWYHAYNQTKHDREEI